MPLTETWTGDLPWMALLLGLTSMVTLLLVALFPAARPVRALVPIPVRSREGQQRAAMVHNQRRRLFND
ncbi:MAG: hypothetical protein HQL98_03005 [Magnetococcales bacterium]|nr:hypothetical protein [Magnetococcales bacterium]